MEKKPFKYWGLIWLFLAIVVICGLLIFARDMAGEASYYKICAEMAREEEQQKVTKITPDELAARFVTQMGENVITETEFVESENVLILMIHAPAIETIPNETLDTLESQIKQLSAKYKEKVDFNVLISLAEFGGDVEEKSIIALNGKIIHDFRDGGKK